MKRTRQGIRRQGFIELGGKGLRLLKPNQIQNVGEFSPIYLQLTAPEDIRL